MAESPEAAPAKPPVKPQKNPFGEPLDPMQLREVFRRLETRPQADQEAFVTRLNWNLLDAPAEHRVIEWMVTNLRSGDEARVAFVLKQLEKQPHPKRGKYAVRFRQVKAELAPELQKRLADVFGPVLGGAPKRPGAHKAAVAAAKPQAAPVAPPAPAPPSEASGDDLQKLKDILSGKFGGAK